MPRTSRNYESGFYHVIHRSNKELTLFETEKDYLRFYHLMKRIELSGEVLFLEYCLMQTHIHLLLGVRNIEHISPSLRYIFGSYANYYNKDRDRFGSVWAGRCKLILLDESHYFKTIQYIRNNPVEAGIVSIPEDYKWSSARSNDLRDWLEKS